MLLTPADSEILQADDMLVILGENRDLNGLSERIQRT